MRKLKPKNPSKIEHLMYLTCSTPKHIDTKTIFTEDLKVTTVLYEHTANDNGPT